MDAIFIQAGNSIDHTPSADVDAGTVVVQGGLVGVAVTDLPANELGALAVVGVFDFAKKAAGDEIDTGDLVYWEVSGGATKTSGGNTLIGKAVADSADGDATVRVRLSQ